MLAIALCRKDAKRARDEMAVEMTPNPVSSVFDGPRAAG
jgi:hypothetical protein